MGCKDQKQDNETWGKYLVDWLVAKDRKQEMHRRVRLWTKGEKTGNTIKLGTLRKVSRMFSLEIFLSLINTDFRWCPNTEFKYKKVDSRTIIPKWIGIMTKWMQIIV